MASLDCLTLVFPVWTMHIKYGKLSRASLGICVLSSWICIFIPFASQHPLIYHKPKLWEQSIHHLLEKWTYNTIDIHPWYPFIKLMKLYLQQILEYNGTVLQSPNFPWFNKYFLLSRFLQRKEECSTTLSSTLTFSSDLFLQLWQIKRQKWYKNNR